MVKALAGSDIQVVEPAVADLILICVPDDAVRTVSERYAGLAMAHVSGSIPAQALAGKGPKIAIHPLQTVTNEEPADVFDGVRFSVEGDASLRQTAHAVIRAMGGVPIDVSFQQKRALHMAAVMVSNFTVALHLGADQILKDAGFESEAAALLAPLLDRTLANVRSKGARSALTGPASRGDQAIVDQHARSISDDTLRAVYIALSRYIGTQR